MIRKLLLGVVVLLVLGGSFVCYEVLKSWPVNGGTSASGISSPKEISSTIAKGETLFAVFKKYGLSIDDLFAMRQAAASVHQLTQLRTGQPYSIIIDDKNCINSFTYGINDRTILKIARIEGGFKAEKSSIPYESRILTIGGRVEDNLISAIGTQREDLSLALQVSDILAWDIDFNCDLRTGDTFKVVAEGLYQEGVFKKYGRVLSAEFINNNQRYLAYRFEYEGKTGYYDQSGKSLQRAFLKAPLSFRRISSGFTSRRFHPILKIYRPHHGVDYIAAMGTPASATSDGVVVSAGYQGDYGKLVVLAHRNGYKTYYGHLSRIKPGLHQGSAVKQGDVVGYVGSTGLATGPHLHYEIRQNGSRVNPLKFKADAGQAIPIVRMGEFLQTTSALNKTLAQASFYKSGDERMKNIGWHIAGQSEYFFRLN